VEDICCFRLSILSLWLCYCSERPLKCTTFFAPPKLEDDRILPLMPGVLTMLEAFFMVDVRIEQGCLFYSSNLGLLLL
jgi:hypothetical protein